MHTRYGFKCHCGKGKAPGYSQCISCFKMAVKKKRLQANVNKNRVRQENLVKNSQKLPAKNRKKSKIIDALLSGKTADSLRKPEPKKNKTVLYKNLEKILLLKNLEKF